MSENRMRRLPDGSITTDVDTYVQAWRDLVQPLVNATGWPVIGFDPGYKLATGVHRDDVLRLSVHEAETLVSLLLQNKENR